MLISSRTHTAPKQFAGCSESATKVTENIEYFECASNFVLSLLPFL